MKILVTILIFFINSVSYCQLPEWRQFDQSNSPLPSYKVNGITIDSMGTKYIAADKGFIIIKDSTWTIYDYTNSVFNCPHPLAIAIDKNGIKWIATYCQGLVRFDGRDFTLFTSYHPDPTAPWTTSVAVCQNNNVWMGLKMEGVAKRNGTTGIWSYYDTTNSLLPHNTVNAVAVDLQNNKWFGTQNGLAKFDGDSTWTIFNKSNSKLPSNDIKALTVDVYGNVWIGTNGSGLVKYNSEGMTLYSKYDNKSGLKCNTITCLTNGILPGEIWVGTFTGGLHDFNGTTTIAVYDSSNSQLKENYITAAAVESNGTKWIGTKYHGLYAYNKYGVSLPVELMNFGSIIKSNDIILQWNTATEINSLSFDIERRKSAESEWNKIGEMAAAGNSTSPKIYSFTDKNLNNGIYYYRLKMIDIDGQYKFSSEIKAEIKAPLNFCLYQNYPNPFNPSCQISFSIPTALFVQIKIYDVFGSLVKTLIKETLSAGTHTYEFNGSNLASGVYFYTLTTGEFTSTKKMILQK